MMSLATARNIGSVGSHLASIPGASFQQSTAGRENMWLKTEMKHMWEGWKRKVNSALTHIATPIVNPRSCPVAESAVCVCVTPLKDWWIRKLIVQTLGRKSRIKAAHILGTVLIHFGCVLDQIPSGNRSAMENGPWKYMIYLFKKGAFPELC